jgi:hypothetical protein
MLPRKRESSAAQDRGAAFAGAPDQHRSEGQKHRTREGYAATTPIIPHQPRKRSGPTAAPTPQARPASLAPDSDRQTEPSLDRSDLATPRGSPGRHAARGGAFHAVPKPVQQERQAGSQCATAALGATPPTSIGPDPTTLLSSPLAGELAHRLRAQDGRLQADHARRTGDCGTPASSTSNKPLADLSYRRDRA